MHYAPVFHRKVWIDTWYCIIKKLCCPLQFWWYIAKYVTQTERKCCTVSQCYLCWSSAPWRPYQRTMEVAGHFFFQKISSLLLHLLLLFLYFCIPLVSPATWDGHWEELLLMLCFFWNLWSILRNETLCTGSSCIFLTIGLDGVPSFHTNIHKYALGCICQ